MPATRLLPPTQEIQKKVDEGWSHRRIAEWWEETTGIRVGRSAIAADLSRNGTTNIKRYDDTIPWKVKTEHANSYTIWMLRIAHRLKHNDKVSDSELERYTSWKRQLDEDDAVIDYVPETQAGFIRVRKEPGEDLIRKPVQRRE